MFGGLIPPLCVHSQWGTAEPPASGGGEHGAGAGLPAAKGFGAACFQLFLKPLFRKNSRHYICSFLSRHPHDVP